MFCILSGINKCISIEDNLDVMKAFSEDEILEVLKNMDLTKAPSTDDFLVLFYQKYLHIVGKEFSLFCLHILNGGVSLDKLNITSIVLIPKIKNLTKM